MFTGLIEQLGKIESSEDRRGQRKLRIQTNWSDLQAGEKVSVNGVGLTVSESGPKGEAQFTVSAEMLERSTLGKLQAGAKVNLERALQMNGRMTGHWVQGHTDVQGMVLNCVEGTDHHKITLALDPKYGRYCVERGSISIDGVSLTINSLTETRLNEFMVTFLISPPTWKSTTLSELKIGDAVNVEVDVLAKYIERLCPQLSALQAFSMPVAAMATETAPVAEILEASHSNDIIPSDTLASFAEVTEVAEEIAASPEAAETI